MKCFVCGKHISPLEEHVKMAAKHETSGVLGENNEVSLRICMECYKNGTDSEDRR